MAGCFRWVLRALVTTSGEKGGQPGRRWMSRCAALLRACTPASVRLEIVNLTGSTEFSRLAASCGNRTAMAKARGIVRGVWAGIGAAYCFFLPKPVIALASPPESSVPQQRDGYPSRPQLHCGEKQEGIICTVWDLGPQARSFRPGQRS